MKIDFLLQFCRIIGIETTDIKKAETLRDYSLSIDVAAQKLKNISKADIDTLIGIFTEGLTLTIGINDSLPLLEVKRGQVTDDLETSLKHIEQRDDSLNLNFNLSLNKIALLKKFNLKNNQYNSLLFLFKDNLIKFFQAPLPKLDNNLFIDSYLPTIIVVLDANIHYSGPFLTIVGLDDLQKIKRDSLITINKSYRENIDRYHTTALNFLTWLGFEFKFLTPLHFLFDRVSGNDNKLNKIIANHLLHLCILYTANRSNYDKGYFYASFISSERIVTLRLGKGDIAYDLKSVLRQLVFWPYEGKETDRLIIFQTVIARELENEDPKDNYYVFCNRIEYLINEALWHHRVFLEGQINKHFELIQSVTDYLIGVAKEVSQKLDSVTKGFTDTLLATVGVIVLTLLASLVKNETQSIIFKLGMYGYALYLFLFQGIYRLGSIWHSYILLQKETKERLAIYVLKFGKQKVNDLLSPLRKRRNQFLMWFLLTIAIYIVVIILIIILGCYLPQYLEHKSKDLLNSII